MVGWKFDNLDILVRQRQSEALYSACRRTDAGKSFLELVNTYEEEVYTSGTIIEWISGEFTFCLFAAAHQPFASDFTQRYISTPESDGHNLLTLCTNMATPRTDLTPLLREWAKATLTSRSWRDALDLAVNVSISLRYRTLRRIDALFCLQFALPKVAMYQAIVECLEATGCIADATECFHQMMSELGKNIDLEWVPGKWSCISSAALLT